VGIRHTLGMEVGTRQPRLTGRRQHWRVNHHCRAWQRQCLYFTEEAHLGRLPAGQLKSSKVLARPQLPAIDDYVSRASDVFILPKLDAALRGCVAHSVANGYCDQTAR
jgi:hypothetical protein